MTEPAKAIVNAELLTETQWCVIFSYLHKVSYGDVPPDYRKTQFMEFHANLSVSKIVLKLLKKVSRELYLAKNILLFFESQVEKMQFSAEKSSAVIW